MATKPKKRATVAAKAKKAAPKKKAASKPKPKPKKKPVRKNGKKAAPKKKAASKPKPKPKPKKKPVRKNGKKPAPKKKAASKPKRKPVRKNGANTLNKRKRRNAGDQAEAAMQLYTDFHGREPSQATEYRREIEYRSKLAELGKLKRLDVITVAGSPHEIDFSGPIKVCAAPYGDQLYFIGGSQAIDLESLDLGNSDTGKDHVFLGACPFIVYDTLKGFHDFEPTLYGHEFAEDGGEYPMLHYDQLNRLVYLTGGSYKVRPEGIID